MTAGKAGVGDLAEFSELSVRHRASALLASITVNIKEYQTSSNYSKGRQSDSMILDSEDLGV
jgi:hypothetical protein